MIRSFHLLVAGFALAALAGSAPAAAPSPNLVIVFADDLGYADLACYGAKGLRTPHLDRLARQGLRFTSFCVPQAVCSASRAALLTGCYPNRVGLLGALGPRSKTGISPHERTIADVLRTRGYATAVFGKWHLGDAPVFLPLRHGFDQYFGLPYSNDMWPKHPDNPKAYPPLPLIQGERTVQEMPDQTRLTRWYTEHSVRFIEQNRARPFFLYVPHNMPHVPLHVSTAFRAKSARGLYGDVIMEIDWSVGQILAALRKNQLDDQTLVVFASDNGPWLLYGDHAGSAGPLREGKGTVFEGGVRVPCLMRWPGRIPKGAVCHELACSMDVLPTFAALAGAELPQDRVIDGENIWPLVSGQRGAKTPHEAFFYYWGKALQAIRSGPWKLHLPHSYPHPEPSGGAGKPGKHVSRRIGLALYNLETDLGETTDVAARHPDVVRRLQELAERCRDDLGDSETKRVGKNVREPGRLPE